VAMQMRASHEGQTTVDVCFEGTEAGISAQAAHVRELAGGLVESVPEPEPWSAREELWRGSDPALVTKISVVPAEIASVIKAIAGKCDAARLQWKLVAQAFGLLALRLEGGGADSLVNAALHLRKTLAPSPVGKSAAPRAPKGVSPQTPQFEVHAKGEARGSLVVLHRPAGATVKIDAWGTAGDALPLMRRVKERFDPKAILNPARFVGGI
jgi:glycolate oxidase FAD binding subunit